MTDKLQRVFNAVLRSNNLSLDEAITVAQNRPLWRVTDVCVWRSAPLVVLVTQEEEDSTNKHTERVRRFLQLMRCINYLHTYLLTF